MASFVLRVRLPKLCSFTVRLRTAFALAAPLGSALLIGLLVAAPARKPAAPAPVNASLPSFERSTRGDVELIPESVLESNLLVTWYGNPRTDKMGILGEFEDDALAEGLNKQAKAFQGLTWKRVQPAYELVAVVAQDRPGPDGLWRRRETRDVIERVLAQARAHHFKLIIDIQVGHSTVKSEFEYVRRYLEEPDVYLALDPEFHMWEAQQPGRAIGHTLAEDVNYAAAELGRIVAARKLPPKVLIVHQFTMNMLPDKENVKHVRGVDVALDMDGLGSRPLKRAIYRMVMHQPLEFAAIKLFYRKDPNLLLPEDVLVLNPVPSVVVYQ
jgi:hypothetical protein